MKKLFLVLFIVIMSCSKSDEEEGCKPMPLDYFCISRSSDVTNFLKIKITTDQLNTTVPIAVYSGNSVENGTLLFKDTISRSTFYEVSDGNYAARAYYTATVNGALSKVRTTNDTRISAKEVEYCEDECFEPAYGDIDLTL